MVTRGRTGKKAVSWEDDGGWTIQSSNRNCFRAGHGGLGGRWRKRDVQGTAAVGAAETGVVMGLKPGDRFTGNCIWGVGKRGEYYVYSRSGTRFKGALR